jgi:hypothetical protein
MKHLRKYNEDIESDLQGIEYIKNCFIDFIDKGALIEIGDDNEYIQIIINLPGISNNNGSWENNNSLDTIEERIEFHEISKEFYLDVDNCVNKVKIKFPNKEFNFEIDEEDDGHPDYLFEASLMITYNFDD